ncbi:MAG: hypothetical protein HZC55_24825 [Verrucomicrobia bacterium]|nr:hypothetical protein [Verrucomicrobiota bacterium]
MFELERELRWWREAMSGAGHAPEILAELEEHLREDVERRARAGTSLPDAWIAARDQIGEPGALRREFARAGRVDLIGTLRAHQWKLLLCVGAGLLTASYFHLVRPATYQSEAKLFLRWSPPQSQPAAGDPVVRDGRRASLLQQEVEIMSSMDLAVRVAENLGAARILGGPGDVAHAAAAVRRGLTVSGAPHSSVVHASFHHPNAELVPIVLSEVLREYLRLRRLIPRESHLALPVEEQISNVSLIQTASPAFFDFNALVRLQIMPVLAGILAGVAWVMVSRSGRRPLRFARHA